MTDPIETYGDLWFGPSCSVGWVSGWLAGPVAHRYDRLLLDAWRGLVTDPVWHAWLTEHLDALHPLEAFRYLQVDDREKRLIRRSRDGGLSFFLPGRELLAARGEADAVRAVFTDVLRSFYARLARANGVPAPP